MTHATLCCAAQCIHCKLREMQSLYQHNLMTEISHSTLSTRCRNQSGPFAIAADIRCSAVPFKNEAHASAEIAAATAAEVAAASGTVPLLG